MNKITSYIKGAIEEMKKVTWPTRKETYHYTMLIIGISVGTALFLGLLDYLFSMGIQTLLFNF